LASQQYAKNDRKFIESPTINLEHWTNGYHWAKSNKEVFTKSNGDLVEYYCTVTETLKLLKTKKRMLKKCDGTPSISLKEELHLCGL
jgi:hypothetical protein